MSIVAESTRPLQARGRAAQPAPSRRGGPRIDASLADIAHATPDPQQRQLLLAMLFEQLKMSVKMNVVLQQLRARAGQLKSFI